MVKSNKRTYSSKSRKRISKGGSRKRISKGGSRKRISKGGSRKRILKGGASFQPTDIKVDGMTVLGYKKGGAQNFYPALKILSDTSDSTPKQTLYMKNKLVDKLVEKLPFTRVKKLLPPTLFPEEAVATNFKSYLNSKFDLYYDSLGEGSGWSKIFFRYKGKRYPYDAKESYGIKAATPQEHPLLILYKLLIETDLIKLMPYYSHVKETGTGATVSTTFAETMVQGDGARIVVETKRHEESKNVVKEFAARLNNDKLIDDPSSIEDLGFLEAFYDYAFFERLYLEERADINAVEKKSVELNQTNFFEEQIKKFLTELDSTGKLNTLREEAIKNIQAAKSAARYPPGTSPGTSPGSSPGTSPAAPKKPENNLFKNEFEATKNAATATAAAAAEPTPEAVAEAVAEAEKVKAIATKATKAATDKANQDFRKFLEERVKVDNDVCAENSKKIVDALLLQYKEPNTFLDGLNKKKKPAGVPAEKDAQKEAELAAEKAAEAAAVAGKKYYLCKLTEALYEKCIHVTKDRKQVEEENQKKQADAEAIKNKFKTFFENQVASSLIVTGVEGTVINTAGGDRRNKGFSIGELTDEGEKMMDIPLSIQCQLVGLTGIRGETDVSSQLNEWSLLLNFGAVAATGELEEASAGEPAGEPVAELPAMFSGLKKKNFKDEFKHMVRVPDGKETETEPSYPTKILTARINYVIDTSIEVAKNFLATGEADAPSASVAQVPVLSLTGAGLGVWSEGFFEKLLEEAVAEQVQADYKEYVAKYNIYKGIQMLREIMKEKKKNSAVLKYPWSGVKYEDFESLVEVINGIDGVAPKLKVIDNKDIGGGFFCILTETPDKKIYVEFGSAASFNLSEMKKEIETYEAGEPVAAAPVAAAGEPVAATPDLEFKVSSQFAWDGGINPIGNEFLMGKFMASGDPQAAAAIDNYKSII